MRYTLNYRLSDGDYYHFNLHHMNTMPAIRRRTRLMHYGFPVFCALYGLLLGWLLDILYIAFIAGILLGMLWLVGYRALNNYALRQRIRKLGMDGRLFYGREITTSFGEDSFTERTADSDCTYRYTLVERVSVGYAGVYLYTGAVVAHIIPRRAFRDEDELKMFVLFVSDRVYARG